MIVDLRGVEARDRQSRKEGGQEIAARLGELVEAEGAAGDLGEDGEQAGTGRRLQHDIVRSDRGGGRRNEAQGDRRRELLEGLALLGAARVRGQKIGDLRKQGCRRGWRPGFPQKRLSVFA